MDSPELDYKFGRLPSLRGCVDIFSGGDANIACCSGRTTSEGERHAYARRRAAQGVVHTRPVHRKEKT